jgi:hypothetical protein
MLNCNGHIEPFTVRKQARSGILRWSKKLVRLLMSAQAEVSQKHAKLLAGEPRFLRVNVITSPGSYKTHAEWAIAAAQEPTAVGACRSAFAVDITQIALNVLNLNLATDALSPDFPD